MTPPKSPPQQAVSVEQPLEQRVWEALRAVAFIEGRTDYQTYWFGKMRDLIAEYDAPPADSVLREALRAARGWVVTCSESAHARRDLKKIDAALSNTAREEVDEYMTVTLSKDGAVTSHNSYDADFDEMVRATQAIITALQERLDGRGRCPYSLGSELRKGPLSAAPKAPTAPIREAGEEVRPIPMLLWCPQCHVQHIDEPDERTPNWDNPPHRSHLCHACGCIWRPADVPTEGVRYTWTRGKADTFDPGTAPSPSACADGWVVGSGDGKRWRTWKDGWSDWTEDREQATRYYRREDAEAVHSEDEDAWAVQPYAALDEQQPEPFTCGYVETLDDEQGEG